MNSPRVLFFVAAAVTVLGAPASQAANQAASQTAVGQARPILVAQASDDVAAAEAAVEAARAAYRAALVAGEDRPIRRAKRAVDEAVEALNAALAAAGLPPADLARAIAMDEAAAAQKVVDNARAELRDAMAKGRQADVERARKRLNRALADLDTARTSAGLAPGEEIDTVAIDEGLPAEGPPPAETAAEPPPPVDTAVGEAPADEPVADLDTAGEKPPQFGAVDPAVGPAVALPKTEAGVKEGEAIEAAGGRVIVKEDGQVTISHDDSERIEEDGSQTQVVKGRDGTTTTTVTRRGGIQVVTVRDSGGNILQRYRKNPDGTIAMLIGEAAGKAGPKSPPPPPPQAEAPSATLDFFKRLAPLVLNIPQQEYVVQSSGASQRQLEQALIAPPVEQVERAYTLEEIRRSGRLRDKVRRIDLDTVTFETGSAIVPADQIPQMQRIGEAIQAIIQRDPTQVLLIEGHTDAAGSDLFNLALSDRRAETVAEILAYYFSIPPENLVTQGYGEQFLKIPTVAPERQNRRVAFRNITWLMRASGQ